jgi:hypothetical protein
VAKRKKQTSKIKPWPDSTFALKTKLEAWGIGRHFWVYLERRAPGRFGRLEAMHGIIPSRGRKDDTAKLFTSAHYRKNVIDNAHELMRQAGVPEAQLKKFMAVIIKEYPYPTQEQLYLGQLDNPLIAAALGKKRQELSYFKTGVLDITAEDLRLIKSCIDDLQKRMRSEPDGNMRFIDLIMGGPIL